MPWRRTWQPTPVFLLEQSCDQRSLVGYSQSLGLQRVGHNLATKQQSHKDTSLLFLSVMRSTRGWPSVYQEEGLHWRTKLPGTLILGFQIPELGEINVCCSSCLVYGILLGHPKQINTHGIQDEAYFFTFVLKELMQGYKQKKNNAII